MNFKLLTFVFVVIGVQSISSSIIRTESFDDLVKIGNLVGIDSNLNGRENPWANIKSFTFNASDTVTMNNQKYSEVNCNNLFNDFCTRGNGKYQAKIVKCLNDDYGNTEKINHFTCELFGAKVLNKNVKYGGLYTISCLPPFTQETAKNRCIMAYNFGKSDSYDEADDVENENEL